MRNKLLPPLVKIRLATVADIPLILVLAQHSPTAAQWNEKQYLELFQPDSDTPEWLILIAESSSTAPAKETTGIDGFLVARHVVHEWELENIVVASSARRRGVGRQLLETLLNTARKTEGVSVFLEVRESNVAARSLYEKSHFRQTGRRPGYYVNPSEDAILYRYNLL